MQVGRVVVVHKWAKPKPGHEFQYHLAWKHRAIMGEWMHRYRHHWSPCLYDRIFRLWANSVNRMKIHGEDVT